MTSRRIGLSRPYKLHQSEGIPKIIESSSVAKRTTFSRRLPRPEESADKPAQRNSTLTRSVLRNAQQQRLAAKLGQQPSMTFAELKAPPKLRTDSVARQYSKIETDAKLKREEEARRQEQKREEARKKEDQRRQQEIEKRTEQQRIREAARKREQQRRQELQQLQQKRQQEKRLEEIRKLERERIAEAEKRQRDIQLREQQRKDQLEREKRELEEKRLEDERKKYLEREREREEQTKREKQARQRIERERLQKQRQEQQEKERRLKEKEEESLRKSALKIGLIGLNNIGNTCYLNSILQCLFNLPAFNSYFLSGKYQTDGKGFYRVAEAYAKLISLIRNTVSRSENPSTLKSAVASRNYQFGGYKQQDANEFLICLLELLGDDLKIDYRSTSSATSTSLLERSRTAWEQHLERENSHINNYFGGQFVSCISCTACQKTAQSFDPFWDVQLSFSKHKKDDDLIAMIEAFTTREQLDGYQCENCKAGNSCYKQVQFVRLPNILVVHLKRFEYDIQEKGVKIDNNMDKYLVRGAKEQSSYQLCGIVEHTGELDYGHYTATCRNPLNSKWYGFNDSTVSENNSLFSGKNEFTSDEPYILFYTRKSLLGK